MASTPRVAAIPGTSPSCIPDSDLFVSGNATGGYKSFVTEPLTTDSSNAATSGTVGRSDLYQLTIPSGTQPGAYSGTLEYAAVGN